MLQAAEAICLQAQCDLYTRELDRAKSDFEYVHKLCVHNQKENSKLSVRALLGAAVSESRQLKGMLATSRESLEHQILAKFNKAEEIVLKTLHQESGGNKSTSKSLELLSQINFSKGEYYLALKDFDQAKRALERSTELLSQTGRSDPRVG
jgi:tetratricopeptide (TPR) repeat protein